MTRSGGAHAILDSLGLNRRDAGVVLGAFLAAPRKSRKGLEAKAPPATPSDADDASASSRDNLDDAIFAHLDEAWARRCRQALAQIRALDPPERASTLRALSRALIASPTEAWTDLDRSQGVRLHARLEAHLREAHPQVAAAIVTSLPPKLGRALASFAPAPCRLPAMLRERIVLATLAHLRDALHHEGTPP